MEVWVRRTCMLWGSLRKLKCFTQPRQINVYLRDNKSQNNSLAYEYILHKHTHAHTDSVSSNIIEVWQWKANRRTHTKVYMLKLFLSLQKIGFLLRKWFKMSPFGYLTYTLTIRGYENTQTNFSYKPKEKYSIYIFFRSESVRLIFEYCLLFSLQIKVFNWFSRTWAFVFVAQASRVYKKFCGLKLNFILLIRSMDALANAIDSLKYSFMVSPLEFICSLRHIFMTVRLAVCLSGGTGQTRCWTNTAFVLWAFGSLVCIFQSLLASFA